MDKELNLKKVIVGISAVIATVITILLWLFKLRGKKRIASWAVILTAIISISLWVWYANLPTFQDTNKSFDQIEQSFGSAKKGDMR
jgi:RsiW-degrading membrane proteinase PrsW (M82 family)